MRSLGRVLIEKTQAGMLAAAERHGLLVEGKIDLRGRRVKFEHTDLDLSAFLLEGADLTGSLLTNCSGEKVSLRACKLKNVRIECVKARKTSFLGASFDEALLESVYLGPRTLDLSKTSYRGARLTDVTFMLARLPEADFTGARLTDCSFRRGILDGASFRGATLTRVSLEEATLVGADFTDAELHRMDQWEEPNYQGAIISDELRYQFGVVRDPARRVDALIESRALGAEATEGLQRLKAQFSDLLSYPECLLIGRELEEAIPPHLFAGILKALKDDGS